MPGESVPQGMWLPPRIGTLFVAANNALDRSRAQCDFLCDGIDDDEQIQEAIDALPASGGRVVLSEGYFICVADITIPEAVTLEGQGYDTVLAFDGDDIRNALTIDGDGVNIKNLIALLVAGAGIGGARPNVIYNDNHDHVLLENLFVYGDESVADDGSDLRQCGILFVDGAYSKIVVCYVSDNDRHGIHLSSPYNCVVEGNYSGSNGYWGILLNSSDWMNIVGNNCDINLGGGISVANSNYCTIVGNDCDTNDTYGILLDGAQENTVTGNTCAGNILHGIYLDDSNDNTISGNTVCLNDSIDTGFWHGVDVNAGSANNQIVGNVCDYNHGRGINVSGPNSGVTGNQCSVNDRDGIYCNGLGCQINSNHVHDNSQDVAGADHGIELGGSADNCQINDNYCDSPGDSQEDGIHLSAGAHYAQIIGNYCSNGMGNGINLAGNNDYCLIKDNYCLDNDDYGIAISAATCEHNTVENNKLTGNGAGAINDAGTGTMLPEIVIDAPNPDGNIGEFPAQLMLDDVDTEIRMKLHCPSTFQQLVRAHVVLVPAAGGDLRRQIDTDFGGVCSEAYNAHSEAVAVDTVAVTANELECIDIAEALTDIAASDWIGVRFTRNGTDVLDTIGDTVYLIGMRMQYV